MVGVQEVFYSMSKPFIFGDGFFRFPFFNFPHLYWRDSCVYIGTLVTS